MNTDPILVVDDDPSVCRLVARVLGRAGHLVQEADSAEAALSVLATQPFALVLADVNMPGASGLQLLHRIDSEYPDTATIMITGNDDPGLVKTALEIGAYGFIVKPFRRNQLQIDVANALKRRDLEIENRHYRERLETTVAERTRHLWSALTEVARGNEELRLAQEDTMHRLAIAAESRDDETAAHVRRMSLYCGLLAGLAGRDSLESEHIRLASALHDVGKIGIPDHILLKAGPLDPDERETMQQHAEIGHHILAGSTSSLLQLAATIALSHHERFDGTGYPYGWAELEIPFEARIAAIADVFDALTSDRIYRRAFPLGEALEIMRQGRGTQFDPHLLDVFFDGMDRVLSIHDEYSDKTTVRGGSYADRD